MPDVGERKGMKVRHWYDLISFFIISFWKYASFMA